MQGQTRKEPTTGLGRLRVNGSVERQELGHHGEAAVEVQERGGDQTGREN
jgi:hypothetical protein